MDTPQSRVSHFFDRHDVGRLQIAARPHVHDPFDPGRALDKHCCIVRRLQHQHVASIVHHMISKEPPLLQHRVPIVAFATRLLVPITGPIRRSN